MNFLPGKRAGDEVDVGGGMRDAAAGGAARRGAARRSPSACAPSTWWPARATGRVFRFKVDTVEALGADSLVHGMLGDGTLVARVDGHETPEPGDVARRSAHAPGKLFFFDTASGKRLRA